jgi:TetR/AcrR family transcriptional regulator, lmrAB and yxaGH operons repressor
MASDSRANMVRSAASLISVRGASGTSLADVLAASGAPRGSIYHHFPQGKRQLAEDAIGWTSERVLAHQRGCPCDSPAQVLDWFFGMWRAVVVASAGSAGCVVAGVAVDTGTGNDAVGSTSADTGQNTEDALLLEVVRATFAAWVQLLTDQLGTAGLPADRARAVATTSLAGMEGALILCRAERGVEPLDAVAAELHRLVHSS